MSLRSVWKQDPSFRLSCGAAVLGIMGLLAIRPGIPAAMLCLATLVHVPLGLMLIARAPADPLADRWIDWARWGQPLAALMLVLAFTQSAGLWAGVLALPWLLLTVLLAGAGGLRLFRRARRLEPEICFDIGLLFVVVGGAWTVMSRFGANPLGFSDMIVLLTGVHFHYAGFALPILVGLAGLQGRRGLAQAVMFGVLLGVPLLALGITVSPKLETLAALLLATAGMGLSVLQLQISTESELALGRRGLLAVSGVAFLFGMALAAIYGWGAWSGQRLLSIPLMFETHGLINALGFSLPGLLAWWWPGASPPSTQPEAASRASLGGAASEH